MSIPQSSRVGSSSSSSSAQLRWLPDCDGAEEPVEDETEARRLLVPPTSSTSSSSSSCLTRFCAAELSVKEGGTGADGVGVFERSSDASAARFRTLRSLSGIGTASAVCFFGVVPDSGAAAAGPSLPCLRWSATDGCSSGSSSSARAHFERPPRTFFVGLATGFGGETLESGAAASPSRGEAAVGNPFTARGEAVGRSAGEVGFRRGGEDAVTEGGDIVGAEGDVEAVRICAIMEPSCPTGPASTERAGAAPWRCAAGGDVPKRCALLIGDDETASGVCRFRGERAVGGDVAGGELAQRELLVLRSTGIG